MLPRLSVEEPSPRVTQFLRFRLLRNGKRKKLNRSSSATWHRAPRRRVGAARLLRKRRARKGLTCGLNSQTGQAVFSASLPASGGSNAQQLEALLAKLRQSAEPSLECGGGGPGRRPFHARAPAGKPASRSRRTYEGRSETPPSGAFFAGDLRTTALASRRLRQTYPSSAAVLACGPTEAEWLRLRAPVSGARFSQEIHALVAMFYRRRGMFDEPGEYSTGAGDLADSWQFGGFSRNRFGDAGSNRLRSPFEGARS